MGVYMVRVYKVAGGYDEGKIYLRHPSVNAVIN